MSVRREVLQHVLLPLITVTLLGSTAARAEIVQVEATVQAIDVPNRAVTLLTNEASGKKTLVLDVSRKAVIVLNNKAAQLNGTKLSP